jgi:hypothetical protein
MSGEHIGWTVREHERRMKEQAELLEAENQQLRDALTWISDPTYVGNYSYPEIVEIHRKWARSALAGTPSEDT